MSDSTHYNLLTTAVQAVGLLLVAGLLLPMARAIPGRFLLYWSAGWFFRTIALFSLYGSNVLPGAEPVFLAVYCVAEYLFGFMLWAGSRELTTGMPLRGRHLVVLLPLLGTGLTAPFLLAAANLSDVLGALLPSHAILVMLLCLFALVATRHYRSQLTSQGIGIWLLRGSLVAMTGLYLQHAWAAVYTSWGDPTVKFDNLAYSPLFDVLLEITLAFGMVVVATDRVRDELQEKNRQLQVAAGELAEAARTDALTGLLNRRAFDELPYERGGGVTSGSLAVLDLNDLKQINDTHGHVAGDVALQLVARALRVQFRVTDPLFRTGGDEFVVVTSGLGAADLASRLEQVDRALQGLRLPGVPAPTDVVVAWGVASFTSAAGLGPAYHKADEEMYQCKKRRKAGLVSVT